MKVGVQGRFLLVKGGMGAVHGVRGGFRDIFHHLTSSKSTVNDVFRHQRDIAQLWKS